MHIRCPFIGGTGASVGFDLQGGPQQLRASLWAALVSALLLEPCSAPFPCCQGGMRPTFPAHPDTVPQPGNFLTWLEIPLLLARMTTKLGTYLSPAAFYGTLSWVHFGLWSPLHSDSIHFLSFSLSSSFWAIRDIFSHLPLQL